MMIIQKLKKNIKRVKKEKKFYQKNQIKLIIMKEKNQS